MRAFIVASCVIYLASYPSMTHGEATKVRTLVTVSGKLFNVMKGAEPALRERDLRPENYTITVVDADSSYFVIFKDPANSGTQFGSEEDELLGFEVELDKRDLRVLRARYIR